MEKIRVLIADDVAQTRREIQRLLYLEEDMLVVGEAADGGEAVRLAESLRPDVVLMDVNMPVLDGIAASEQIVMRFPEVAVVIISIQGEHEYLKRAMLAGARDYLVKPFSGSELSATIRRVKERTLRRQEGRVVRENGQVVAVMSPKGGVGKTTLATNLAVCLAQQGQRVALVDMDLQWGDVAAAMNLRPERTLAELAREESGDRETLESYLLPHLSGVRVLPAPLHPQDAELVDAQSLRDVLQGLTAGHDYTVVDTASGLNEANLQLLDVARQILVVVNQDFPSLKNVRLFLEVLENLGCRDLARLVLNRAEKGAGPEGEALNRALNARVELEVPEDRRLVNQSLERGVPLVISQAGSPVASAVRRLAAAVLEGRAAASQEIPAGQRRRGWLGLGVR